MRRRGHRGGAGGSAALDGCAGTTALDGVEYDLRSRWLTAETTCAQDPEGILGPPRGGHIARLDFQKRLMKDADAREEFNRQLRQENERRRALREAII